MRTLLVDPEPSSDLLEHASEPVWPVRTPEELACLRRLAKLFGARVRFVRGGPRLGQCSSRERVVGLGEETTSATQLYAHLTRRAPAIVEDPDAVLEERPEVVVLTYERLTSRLLNGLSRRAHGPLPGLIVGRYAGWLRAQVLAKAAAASLCGPVVRRRIDIYPLLSPSYPPRRHTLDWGTRPRDVRAALRRGCGVLTLDTHSDGVDAFLGSRLTLCPLDRDRTRGVISRGPYCLSTGVCHRQNLPIADAWRTRRLISPSDIRARILVLNACRSLLLPTGDMDPAWGLAMRLIEANSVGAVLLTWEMTLPAEPESSVASALMTGAPVGHAAMRALSEPRAMALGERVCLLGDPRTRAAPQAARVTPGSRPRDTLRRTGKVTSPDRPLAFLRACLEVGRTSGNTSRQALANSALSAIARYRAAPGAPTARDLRGAILEYVMRRGELFEDWLTFARIERGVRRGSCAHCGEGVRTYVATFPRRPYRERRLDTCPHCEIVRDSPRGIALSLSAHDGRTLRLHGTLPRRRWTAGVLLSSWRQDRLWRWPSAPDGTPQREFQPPGGLPARHVYAALTLVWHTSVVMLRVSTHGSGSVEKYLETAGTLDGCRGGHHGTTADRSAVR